MCQGPNDGGDGVLVIVFDHQVMMMMMMVIVFCTGKHIIQRAHHNLQSSGVQAS